jgi:hypothetical protein
VAAAALGVEVFREALNRTELPASAPARVAVDQLGVAQTVSA